MKTQRVVSLICLFLIVFGLGTGTGIFIQKHNSEMLTVSKDSAAEFQLVEQAWNIIRSNYVDKTATQPQTLAYGTIAGMVNSLGDTGHSTFLTPEEVKQENNLCAGALPGYRG